MKMEYLPIKRVILLLSPADRMKMRYADKRKEIFW